MTTEPIEQIHLFAYGGPNIVSPQPGVLLRVRCDKDRSLRIRNALKDGAQSIGMIIADVESVGHPQDDGLFVITATFRTPTPELGAALASYVVDGVRAQATGDEEWDKDGPLYELQKRRRREALPVAALQLLAEARKRGVPSMRLADGRLQLGYGARGWAIEASQAEAAQPPWERLGSVPIYAITGEAQREATVRQVAQQLRAQGHTVHTLDNAGYADTVALLADPSVTLAVVGLNTDELLQRGLPFEGCTQAIITDMQGLRPPAAADDEEWAQALGLPMLVSSGPAIINTADGRLAALAAYAPHGVMRTA
ncbi:MAG: DUF4938 domain-containing protein [Chloroflexaceae bacterium]|nr:DUF4938 domain-containing protein [Chloroflexaceae bacterium]